MLCTFALGPKAVAVNWGYSYVYDFGYTKERCSNGYMNFFKLVISLHVTQTTTMLF